VQRFAGSKEETGSYGAADGYHLDLPGGQLACEFVGNDVLGGAIFVKGEGGIEGFLVFDVDILVVGVGVVRVYRTFW
jgi:hypothetical protein